MLFISKMPTQTTVCPIPIAHDFIMSCCLFMIVGGPKQLTVHCQYCYTLLNWLVHNCHENTTSLVYTQDKTIINLWSEIYREKKFYYQLIC
jgi:hypothetical protein